MAIKTFGTTVAVNGETVGGLMGAEFSGADVNSIDTTTWDSASNTRTFIGGLIEPGSLELSGNLLVSDAGQTELEASTGEVAQVSVEYVDGTTITFDAVVGALNIGSDLDSKLEFNRSLKITGSRTITPPAP
jgi:predicted secreted protein